MGMGDVDVPSQVGLYWHKTKLNKRDHIIIKTVSASLYCITQKGGYIVLLAKTNYPPDSALMPLMALTAPITQETRAQSNA